MELQDPDIVADYLTAFGQPICECGEEAPLSTSWTEVNPVRRFYGCPNYGTPKGKCRFFVWVDPEFPEWAKNVINSLLRKTERLEKEKYEEVKRQRVMAFGKVFVWSVALLSIGVPVFTSMLGLKKE